ncbi:MAG: Sir2 family NAD-dependent protein deacetylase [Opitutaceae bacterium]|jgi:NAD-dependent SIR2 family protein deacetylase
MPAHESPHFAAAKVIASSEALLVCAGAGMGVDSGLPDFRGKEGFWKAYPRAKELGVSFEELANPAWFQSDPALAWGFYGHRYRLYCGTTPHEGFGILLRWAERMHHGHFVFTSNVDGQFQKAGFNDDRVVECHGSLMQLQCVKPCCSAAWPAPSSMNLQIDEGKLLAQGELPRCISCGGLARPNVLMFGDSLWIDGRSSAQEIRFRLWLRKLARGKLAVVEVGAGRAIPTVRRYAEQLSQAAGTPLIRINPQDSEGPADCISIPEGALEALKKIDAALS